MVDGALAARQRRTRILLWAWAIASLASLAYVGLLFLASVPVAGTVAEDVGPAAEGGPAGGARILVLPVSAPAKEVAPVASEDAPLMLGARGDVVAFGGNASEPETLPFPWDADARRFARALVLVQRVPANATQPAAWNVPALNATNVTHVNLTGVPVRNATTGDLERVNATVNLTTFNGTVGFIVKRDHETVENATYVEAARVTGRVDRAVNAFALWGALIFSGLGAALPLVLIALTHRGRGGGTAPLPSGADADACHECGAQLDPVLDFCARCGAEPK